jgi:hypothetical protein
MARPGAMPSTALPTVALSTPVSERFEKPAGVNSQQPDLDHILLAGIGFERFDKPGAETTGTLTLSNDERTQQPRVAQSFAADRADRPLVATGNEGEMCGR